MHKTVSKERSVTTVLIMNESPKRLNACLFDDGNIIESSYLPVAIKVTMPVIDKKSPNTPKSEGVYSLLIKG